MRFVHKKSDNTLFSEIELVNVEGNIIEGKAIKPGDLVAVDFGLQIYELNNEIGNSTGARLVLVSVQQLASNYDPKFEQREKVQLPSVTPPAKRRKY
jgi:hypothetical protein